jgi:hypothetical protein
MSEYIVVNNQTFHLITDDGNKTRVKELCNFSATIVEERIVYGANQTEHQYEYVIQGRTTDGEQLSEVVISENKYKDMKWANESWGAKVTIEPGKERHLGNAIKQLSKGYKRIVKYQQFGWTKINGVYHYIHAGNLIPPKVDCSTTIVVELKRPMNEFELHPCATKEEGKAAIRAALHLINVAKPQTTIPLMAMVFRSVTGEFMPVTHSIHVVGASGNYKSSVAALMQSFFGLKFRCNHLPANWRSTGNILELLASEAKDAVLVIDEFKPTGTKSHQADLYDKAETVFRGSANGSGRQRMSKGLTLQHTYVAKCGIISTGEEMPPGESLRARMLIIEVHAGDVNVQVLTEMQNCAAKGVLSQAMYGFIEYLADNADTIADRMNEQKETLRSRFTCMLDSHPRLPEIMADEYMGMNMFLDYALDSGAISKEEYDDYLKLTESSLLSTVAYQKEATEIEKDTDKFLRYLSAVVTSKTWAVADINSKKSPPRTVGYRDDNGNIFFQMTVAYAAANEMAHKNEDNINLSSQVLKKRLIEEGRLVRFNDGYTTRKPNGDQRPYLVCVREDILIAE